jgi:hypothetical protein
MKDVYNKLLAYNDTGLDLPGLDEIESSNTSLGEKIELVDDVIESVGNLNPVGYYNKEARQTEIREAASHLINEVAYYNLRAGKNDPIAFSDPILNGQLTNAVTLGKEMDIANEQKKDSARTLTPQEIQQNYNNNLKNLALKPNIIYSKKAIEAQREVLRVGIRNDPSLASDQKKFFLKNLDLTSADLLKPSLIPKETTPLINPSIDETHSATKASPKPQTVSKPIELIIDTSPPLGKKTEPNSPTSTAGMPIPEIQINENEEVPVKPKVRSSEEITVASHDIRPMIETAHAKDRNASPKVRPPAEAMAPIQANVVPAEVAVPTEPKEITVKSSKEVTTPIDVENIILNQEKVELIELLEIKKSKMLRMGVPPGAVDNKLETELKEEHSGKLPEGFSVNQLILLKDIQISKDELTKDNVDKQATEQKIKELQEKLRNISKPNSATQEVEPVIPLEEADLLRSYTDAEADIRKKIKELKPQEIIDKGWIGKAAKAGNLDVARLLVGKLKESTAPEENLNDPAKVEEHNDQKNTALEKGAIDLINNFGTNYRKYENAAVASKKAEDTAREKYNKIDNLPLNDSRLQEIIASEPKKYPQSVKLEPRRVTAENNRAVALEELTKIAIEENRKEHTEKLEKEIKKLEFSIKLTPKSSAEAQKKLEELKKDLETVAKIKTVEDEIKYLAAKSAEKEKEASDYKTAFTTVVKNSNVDFKSKLNEHIKKADELGELILRLKETTKDKNTPDKQRLEATQELKEAEKKLKKFSSLNLKKEKKELQKIINAKTTTPEELIRAKKELEKVSKINTPEGVVRYLTEHSPPIQDAIKAAKDSYKNAVPKATKEKEVKTVSPVNANEIKVSTEKYKKAAKEYTAAKDKNDKNTEKLKKATEEAEKEYTTAKDKNDKNTEKLKKAAEKAAEEYAVGKDKNDQNTQELKNAKEKAYTAKTTTLESKGIIAISNESEDLVEKYQLAAEAYAQVKDKKNDESKAALNTKNKAYAIASDAIASELIPEAITAQQGKESTTIDPKILDSLKHHITSAHETEAAQGLAEVATMGVNVKKARNDFEASVDYQINQINMPPVEQTAEGQAALEQITKEERQQKHEESLKTLGLNLENTFTSQELKERNKEIIDFRMKDLEFFLDSPEKAEAALTNQETEKNYDKNLATFKLEPKKLYTAKEIEHTYISMLNSYTEKLKSAETTAEEEVKITQKMKDLGTAYYALYPEVIKRQIREVKSASEFLETELIEQQNNPTVKPVTAKESLPDKTPLTPDQQKISDKLESCRAFLLNDLKLDTPYVNNEISKYQKELEDAAKTTLPESPTPIESKKLPEESQGIVSKILAERNKFIRCGLPVQAANKKANDNATSEDKKNLSNYSTKDIDNNTATESPPIDFKEEVNDYGGKIGIRSRLNKLGAKEIIDGNLIKLAAEAGNIEAVNRLINNIKKDIVPEDKAKELVEKEPAETLEDRIKEKVEIVRKDNKPLNDALEAAIVDLITNFPSKYEEYKRSEATAKEAEKDAKTAYENIDQLPLDDKKLQEIIRKNPKKYPRSRPKQPALITARINHAEAIKELTQINVEERRDVKIAELKEIIDSKQTSSYAHYTASEELKEVNRIKNVDDEIRYLSEKSKNKKDSTEEFAQRFRDNIKSVDDSEVNFDSALIKEAIKPLSKDNKELVKKAITAVNNSRASKKAQAKKSSSAEKKTKAEIIPLNEETEALIVAYKNSNDEYKAAADEYQNKKNDASTEEKAKPSEKLAAKNKAYTTATNAISLCLIPKAISSGTKDSSKIDNEVMKSLAHHITRVSTISGDAEEAALIPSRIAKTKLDLQDNVDYEISILKNNPEQLNNYRETIKDKSPEDLKELAQEALKDNNLVAIYVLMQEGAYAKETSEHEMEESQELDQNSPSLKQKKGTRENSKETAQTTKEKLQEKGARTFSELRASDKEKKQGQNSITLRIKVTNAFDDNNIKAIAEAIHLGADKELIKRKAQEKYKDVMDKETGKKVKNPIVTKITGLTNGETLLTQAAKERDYKEVERLLADGSNPNIPDNTGRTALDYLNEQTSHSFSSTKKTTAHELNPTNRETAQETTQANEATRKAVTPVIATADKDKTSSKISPLSTDRVTGIESETVTTESNSVLTPTPVIPKEPRKTSGKENPPAPEIGSSANNVDPIKEYNASDKSTTAKEISGTTITGGNVANTSEELDSTTQGTTLKSRATNLDPYKPEQTNEATAHELNSTNRETVQETTHAKGITDKSNHPNSSADDNPKRKSEVQEPNHQAGLKNAPATNPNDRPPLGQDNASDKSTAPKATKRSTITSGNVANTYLNNIHKRKVEEERTKEEKEAQTRVKINKLPNIGGNSTTIASEEIHTQHDDKRKETAVNSSKTTTKETVIAENDSPGEENIDITVDKKKNLQQNSPSPEIGASAGIATPENQQNIRSTKRKREFDPENEPQSSRARSDSYQDNEIDNKDSIFQVEGDIEVNMGSAPSSSKKAIQTSIASNLEKDDSKESNSPTPIISSKSTNSVTKDDKNEGPQQNPPSPEERNYTHNVDPIKEETEQDLIEPNDIGTRVETADNTAKAKNTSKKTPRKFKITKHLTNSAPKENTSAEDKKAASKNDVTNFRRSISRKDKDEKPQLALNALNDPQSLVEMHLDILLQNGADHKKILQAIKKHPQKEDTKLETIAKLAQGSTLLGLAAERGNFGIVDDFISLGYEVNALDCRGKTSLDYINEQIENGATPEKTQKLNEAVSALKERGAKTFAELDSPTQELETKPKAVQKDGNISPLPNNTPNIASEPKKETATEQGYSGYVFPVLGAAAVAIGAGIYFYNNPEALTSSTALTTVAGDSLGNATALTAMAGNSLSNALAGGSSIAAALYGMASTNIFGSSQQNPHTAVQLTGPSSRAEDNNLPWRRDIFKNYTEAHEFGTQEWENALGTTDRSAEPNSPNIYSLESNFGREFGNYSASYTIDGLAFGNSAVLSESLITPAANSSSTVVPEGSALTGESVPPAIELYSRKNLKPTRIDLTAENYTTPGGSASLGGAGIDGKSTALEEFIESPDASIAGGNGTASLGGTPEGDGKSLTADSSSVAQKGTALTGGGNGTASLGGTPEGDGKSLTADSSSVVIPKRTRPVIPRSSVVPKMNPSELYSQQKLKPASNRDKDPNPPGQLLTPASSGVGVSTVDTEFGSTNETFIEMAAALTALTDALETATTALAAANSKRTVDNPKNQEGPLLPSPKNKKANKKGHNVSFNEQDEEILPHFTKKRKRKSNSDAELDDLDEMVSPRLPIRPIKKGMERFLPNQSSDSNMTLEKTQKYIEPEILIRVKDEYKDKTDKTILKESPAADGGFRFDIEPGSLEPGVNVTIETPRIDDEGKIISPKIFDIIVLNHNGKLLKKEVGQYNDQGELTTLKPGDDDFDKGKSAQSKEWVNSLKPPAPIDITTTMKKFSYQEISSASIINTSAPATPKASFGTLNFQVRHR